MPPSAANLAHFIRSGDGVIVGQACAEPQTLVEILVAQRAAFSGAHVFLGVNYSGIVKPGHADHLKLSSYCGAGHNRALADAGVLDIHPHPYSRLAPLIRQRKIPGDVVLVQVSPPNARGEHSMGLAVDYLLPAIESARAVIAEVNERIPWTHTEKLFRKEDFALLVESSRDPAARLPRAPATSRRRSRGMPQPSFPTAPRSSSASASCPTWYARNCWAERTCGSTPGPSATASPT